MAVASWFSRLDVKGRFTSNEPMAGHCSWRAGGVAARYFEPQDLADLERFLRQVPDGEPLVWIGLGSNMLVRDGGIAGTVIATHAALGEVAWESSEILRAQAGVPCAKVAREATRAGAGGCEFLAGIPGTIGGALAMNAGAFGSEIWDLVTAVETIDRRGQRHTHARAEYIAVYRAVRGPVDEWFVSATLRLVSGTDAAAAARVRELISRRNATQPVGQASCGSVFKNPVGNFAGRLIEHAGLKGCRIGGCRVSDKHANFIVNDRGASATDIESLIEHVQQKVFDCFGIRLQPEVRIIGLRTGSDAGGAR